MHHDCGFEAIGDVGEVLEVAGMEVWAVGGTRKVHECDGCIHTLLQNEVVDPSDVCVTQVGQLADVCFGLCLGLLAFIGVLREENIGKVQQIGHQLSKH